MIYLLAILIYYIVVFLLYLIPYYYYRKEVKGERTIEKFFEWVAFSDFFIFPALFIPFVGMNIVMILYLIALVIYVFDKLSNKIGKIKI